MQISCFRVIPLVSALITAYFIYHGIYGNRGLLRLNQIQQEYTQETKIADTVQKERDLLQKKVQSFKRGAPDLIQEEALRVLNMGGEDSLILLESP